MREGCSSGKRMYETESLAVEALIQNHIINNYRGGQGPTNVYQCDECGHWHFTSKGAKNEIFDDSETIKMIEREKRALNWERSLR